MLSTLPPPPAEKSGWPWTEETDPNLYDKNISHPKVSIVTPSFNQGEYIEETIRSILLQNYPNLEYIVIDGGSTDGTVDVIKKYSPWLTFWQSEKDRGQSHAINKGLERLTGEIGNWINSDDCLTQNALQTITGYFSNNRIQAFCGNALIGFEEGKKGEVLFRTSLLNEGINTHLANCSFSQPATFFRMSAFRRITPVEESLHMNMDMYMWYRFVCLYGLDDVASTDEIVCTVKAHKDAKTIKNFEKSLGDKQRIYDSLFSALGMGYKKRSRVLPLTISPQVKKKIVPALLRKNFCRTHFWHADTNGKIIKINFPLIVEWFFHVLKRA